MYEEVVVRELIRGGMRTKKIERLSGNRAGAPDDHKVTEKIFCTSFESRIGRIYVASSDKGVCKISVPRETHKDFFRWLAKHFSLDAVVDNRSKNKDIIDQLNRYFNGRLVKFTFPFDLIGTPFQIKVWKELTRVAYGTTATYKQIARRISVPGGSQAVGKANAENPLPIVIPCHRIIGSNGSLTGYSCGIKTKEFLLRLEGAIML
jgi:O-6-methylguanine DNA methyltransferase